MVVTARRASVSFTSDMDTLPDFLRHNFSHSNLMVIYPEQFGAEAPIGVMADAMSPDVETAPMPIWAKVKTAYLRWRANRRTSNHSTDDRDLTL